MDYSNSVSIPERYFLDMARKDYSNIYEALIREFFQNSVDAGAKNFHINITGGVVTVTDDGCGMDRDTIVNKLLVMGGSGKDGDSSVGAFGHAKILLYFAWDSYEIRTRDILVKGKSNLYSIFESDSYVDGVISKIVVGDDAADNIMYQICPYFAKCYTKCNVSFSIGDGESVPVHQWTKEVGDSISDMVHFNAFLSDIGDGDRFVLSNRIIVRTNGVAMFTSYNRSLDNPVVISTKVHPYRVFNQNRDSLKSEPRAELDDFMRKLAVDSVSTVRQMTELSVAAREGSTDYRHSVCDCDGISWFGVSPEHASSLTRKCGMRRLIAIRKFVVDEIIPHVLSQEVSPGRFVFIDRDRCLGLVTRVTIDDNETVTVLGIAPEPLICRSIWSDPKRMVYDLLDTVCHEVTHIAQAVNNADNYYGYHDEGFVLEYHRIRRIFWDLASWTKVWDRVWKSTRGYRLNGSDSAPSSR